MRVPSFCLLLVLVAGVRPARAQPVDAPHAGLNFGAVSIDGQSECSLIATVTVDVDGLEFTTFHGQPDRHAWRIGGGVAYRF